MAHAYSGQGKWFGKQRTPEVPTRLRPVKRHLRIRMKCSRRYHLLRGLGCSVQVAFKARTNYAKFCAALEALGKNAADYPELSNTRALRLPSRLTPPMLAPELVRKLECDPSDTEPGAQVGHRPND